MSKIGVPEIVIVDRMNDGILLKFNDGRCAFYSSALLYAKLPESEELDEDDLDW